MPVTTTDQGVKFAHIHRSSLVYRTVKKVDFTGVQRIDFELWKGGGGVIEVEKVNKKQGEAYDKRKANGKKEDLSTRLRKDTWCKGTVKLNVS